MRAWGAIAVAFWASSAGAGEQALPVYPGVVHTRIGNDLVIAGEYYRMAYFVTADSMEQVGKYFHGQWSKLGYPVMVDGDFKEEAVVSAFYTREGLVRSVVLRRHAGKTVGLTVLKDLWLREPVPAASGLVPLEGTLYSHDLMARDDPGGTQNRSMLIGRPLDQTKQELDRKMTGRGFHMIRQTGAKREGKPGWVLEYNRGKEQVVSWLSEVEPEVTAVSQTWIGSDRPDAIPNDEALRRAQQRYRPRGGAQP